MDPVSIGVAAAALLGSKAVEEFATHAGSTAWQAVQRMGSSVRSHLSPSGSQALDQLTAGEAAGEARAVVAGEVEDAARSDPDFRAELEALVAEAGRSKQLATVVAGARDHAKHVNIGGDNSGPISF